MSYVTDKFDDKVIKSLKEGGVGFMPADTVYGLSCRALNETAVERIYRFKYRFVGKPFIVLISDTSQLKQLNINVNAAAPIEKYWPGSITFVCDAPNSPKWLHRGTKTLAVRMSSVKQLRRLIKSVGPIVSTSANLYARKPANSLAQAMDYFGEKIDFYVDTGEINGLPSTIIRLKRDKLEVLRQGTVKID